MSNTNAQFDSTLIGQRQLRLSKLEKLAELGVNPYPAKAQKQYDNAEIVEKFADFEGKTVTLAGRVGAKRGHGKLMFIDLIDDSGRIQVYLKDDTLQATDVSDKESQYLGFEHLDLIDVADYIQVTGQIVKTERGEISIAPEKLRLLTKTIRPLPANLEDKEERFRRRYVDMKVHPEIKDLMKRRAAFWEAHRQFFNSRGFSEVNIPVLEHVPGGGDAVPFSTHMNAIDEDFFLRISHELPLKRLIGAGFEKVYDIGARFRNEGLSEEHLPEHVAMEFYWAYADWKDGMKMIQDLYNFIIDSVYKGQRKFQIREFEVEFKPEWDVIDFNAIMKEIFGIADIYSVEIDAVKELLTKHGIEFERSINVPRGVDALWKQVRKTIVGPAFLINHPKYLSPLQKPSLDNPNMVERFQPIIAGSELGNGWSEVNDPVDQYQRFLEQQQLRDAGDEEAQWLDVDYVEMLEYGMAPTFGYGHSERVFWFLENVVAREGVPFPQLKQDFDDLTKKIYTEIEFEKILEKKHTTAAPDEHRFEYENVSGLPTLEEAQKLIEEHVTDTYHKLHAQMVATGMKAYAKKFGANQELWYLTGLLHDLDYTKLPEQHPFTELEWFKEWGYPEELIHAVAAHDHVNTGIAPQTPIAKALIAVDEMSGLIYAYSLMKGGDFKNLDAKSTLKKFNDKKFAAKIDRDEIMYGVKALGLDLEKHITFLINAFAKMGEPEVEVPGKAAEKIVIVINKAVSGWKFANTVGHLSTYLGAKVGKQDLLQTDNFTTADGAIPANAKLAIIIKQATSNEELQSLANAAKNQKLPHLGFVKEMLEFHTDAEVQAAVSGKTSDQLEYLGVGVYGSIKDVDALTAAFKLWE
jgi:lysyl-tRNA synthetase, class II